MMLTGVRLTRGFQVHGCADLDAHTDDVMEELLKLETDRLTDSDVSADLANERVDISVFAIDVDFDSAFQKAESAIRTAIHAAGGSTPNWETLGVNADREILPA